MVELRDGSAWRIWPGDIPKTLQWLPTTERCRGHRGRNLFARAGRSLEWIEGASNKSQRGLACRRRPALPPRGLSSRDAASRVDVFRFGAIRALDGAWQAGCAYGCVWASVTNLSFAFR
jgi:hypothetical protein